MLSVQIMVSAILLHAGDNFEQTVATLVMAVGPGIQEVKLTDDSNASVKKHLLLANLVAFAISAVMVVLINGLRYWIISIFMMFFIIIGIRKSLRTYFG